MLTDIMLCQRSRTLVNLLCGLICFDKVRQISLLFRKNAVVIEDWWNIINNFLVLVIPLKNSLSCYIYCNVYS
jgi:hypothetical protein